MKYIFGLVLLSLTFLAIASDDYKSGENTGLGKIERLDKSEKFLEEISKRIGTLEKDNEQLKEEMRDLKNKIKNLELKENPPIN